MNILIVADLVTFSGVGNYIKALSGNLALRGNNVVVASPINDLGLGNNDNIKFVKLKKISKNPILCLKNVRLISKIVKSNNIDVIHANHRMISFVVSIYNKLHKHVPAVWTAHTVPYPMSLSKRIFAYYGDRSIAISSEAQSFMKEQLKISADNIDLILNGVDEKLLTPLTLEEKCEKISEFGLDCAKKIICMHGRIDKVKGIDLLVEAVKQLSDEEKSQIQIVCSGSYNNNEYFDSISALINSYGLSNIFKFVGWRNTREIVGISNLLVMPSRREGFPLTAAEAFFMGVPVIRSKTGGFNDMKEYCVGIEVESVSDIVKQLKRFIYSQNDFTDMADRAKEFANNNLTIEIMTDSVLCTYKKAISKWSKPDVGKVEEM